MRHVSTWKTADLLLRTYGQREACGIADDLAHSALCAGEGARSVLWIRVKHALDEFCTKSRRDGETVH
jgi:hypothetical protein